MCEALWHGVPLVVAPIRDDQPIVAYQVVDAGAGVRLRFGRADAARIGAAVDAVLDPARGHRKAAEAVGESFRAAGGGASAADHLEAVAAGSAGATGTTGAAGVIRPDGPPGTAESSGSTGNTDGEVRVP